MYMRFYAAKNYGINLSGCWDGSDTYGNRKLTLKLI